MLAHLSIRKAKFPILIISAVDETRLNWRSWGPSLNVSFLSKPVDFKEFRTAVETALQAPARRVP